MPESRSEITAKEWNHGVELALGSDGCDFWPWIDANDHDVPFSPWTDIKHAFWALDELRKLFPEMAVQMMQTQNSPTDHLVWIYPHPVLRSKITVARSKVLSEAICAAIVG